MIEATQSGADIQTAANAFLGMLDAAEPSESPSKAQSEESAPEKEVPATSPEPENESEGDSEDHKETDNENPEDAPYEVPDSLDKLAQDFGIEPDKLLNVKVKTKIDGVEGEVKLADLVKSHQLEGHLNRQNMALAEQRKAFEQETLQHKQVLAQRIHEADAFAQMFQNQLIGETNAINWEQLRQDDPAEYAAKRQEYNERHQAIQYARSQLQNQVMFEAQQSQQKQAQTKEQMLAYERNKLLEVIPEWKDTSKYDADRVALKNFLSEIGYSAEEISELYDHRAAVLARDAMRYRQLQKAKPELNKKIVNVPKVLKPGSPKDRSTVASENRNAQFARLRKSGRVEDAASIMMGFV